jgi:hypothetical protein
MRIGLDEFPDGEANRLDRASLSKREDLRQYRAMLSPTLGL